MADVFQLAHRLKCKGPTVFRCGSGSGQVLELGAGESGYEREFFTKIELVEKVDVAGSIHRRREAIGDMDLLIMSVSTHSGGRTSDRYAGAGRSPDLT